MNWGQFFFNNSNRVENSFKTLANRKMSQVRCEERRCAEHRTTKHQLQARKSCVSDARAYRVARRLPISKDVF
jgi:hypothetical protein